MVFQTIEVDWLSDGPEQTQSPGAIFEPFRVALKVLDPSYAFQSVDRSIGAVLSDGEEIEIAGIWAKVRISSRCSRNQPILFPSWSSRSLSSSQIRTVISSIFANVAPSRVSRRANLCMISWSRGMIYPLIGLTSTSIASFTYLQCCAPFSKVNTYMQFPVGLKHL